MDELKQCQFCKALGMKEDYNEFINACQDPKEREALGKLMDVYTVGLITHTWYKKLGKRKASRSTDYRNRGLGYSLNYCPECGKKLTGG